VNMQSLELKVPPPIVALLLALLMRGIRRFTLLLEIPESVRIVGALVVAVAGIAFIISGAVAFRRAKTTVNPLRPQQASSLVTSGIYRVTRNPMYVGLLLVLVAWAIWQASPWALLGPLAFLAYIQRFQIGPEERALFGLFGAEFSAYKARVRPWL
jgi:protein-S-isoprenylcysteine O-methyltransferase Ste14